MPENINALQNQLTAACAEIVDRLNEATDPDEIESLNKTLATLQTQLDLATQAALDNAAGAIAQAAEAMRDVIASAHTDPIQQFVDLMQGHIAQLDEIVPGAAAPTAPVSDDANHQFLIDALDVANVTSRLIRNGLAAIIEP